MSADVAVVRTDENGVARVVAVPTLVLPADVDDAVLGRMVRGIVGPDRTVLSVALCPLAQLVAVAS